MFATWGQHNLELSFIVWCQCLVTMCACYVKKLCSVLKFCNNFALSKNSTRMEVDFSGYFFYV